MKKREDRDTRYFIDLDLQTRSLVALDYDQRPKLAMQDTSRPLHHRVFLTKGQYRKLESRLLELKSAGPRRG